MQPPSESDVTHAQTQPIPSTGIDAVICDLITHIEAYSDDNFDADWMYLTNLEVEGLVIAVIRHLIETMNGKLLSGYLLEIRQKESHATEDETGLAIVEPR